MTAFEGMEDQDLPQRNLAGIKDEYRRFELSLPFSRTMINGFIDKVDTAETVSGGEGFVNLDALQEEFTTDAWVGLSDPESPLNKLLKSSLFVTSKCKEGQVQADRLKLFGLLHCQGAVSDKAKYLLAQFQGGFDKAEWVSAGDGDITPAITSLCAMSAWGLFEIAGEKEFVTNYYKDDIDALVEQIDVIKEDQFLEDIFGPESRLENEPFINKLTENAFWIFDSVDLRRRLFEAASVEAKHFNGQ